MPTPLRLAAPDPSRGSATGLRRKKPLHIHAKVDRSPREWIGVEVVSHEVRLFGSERLIPVCPDDDFVLVKQLFEFALCNPPTMCDLANRP